MGKKKWCLTVGLVLFFTLMLGGWEAQVQCQEKYPTRAIDIIVPFGPGGSTDLHARATGAYVSKKWKIPVNVINKPGGRGIPATQDVYRATPDGYTLLADNHSSCSMLAAGVKDLPFKILDRPFLGMNSGTPFMVIVPATSPFKTINDLLSEAKKNPEKMSYTSLGGASSPDFVLRVLFKEIGADISKMTVVMCQGGAQAVTLTAGGNVTIGVASGSASLPSVRAGVVRALLVTSKDREPDFPDVPSCAELGYRVIISWNGISGPPKMPSYIIDIWDKALKESVNDPTFVAQLKKIGAMPYYHSPETMKEYVRQEIEEASKLF